MDYRTGGGVKTHHSGEVSVLVVYASVNLQYSLEAFPYLLSVAHSIVAEDQVQSCREVRLLIHNVLKRVDGIGILPHLYKDCPNVLENLQSEVRMGE